MVFGLLPHNRSETMVADPTKQFAFIRPGKRYLFSETKIASNLSENDCFKLSYAELKTMIKEGYYSETLAYVANNKEEKLFSTMFYEELFKLKKKGSYHCINYETLLKYLDDKRQT